MSEFRVPLKAQLSLNRIHRQGVPALEEQEAVETIQASPGVAVTTSEGSPIPLPSCSSSAEPSRVVTDTGQPLLRGRDSSASATVEWRGLVASWSAQEKALVTGWPAADVATIHEWKAVFDATLLGDDA